MSITGVLWSDALRVIQEPQQPYGASPSTCIAIVRRATTRSARDADRPLVAATSARTNHEVPDPLLAAASEPERDLTSQE